MSLTRQLTTADDVMSAWFKSSYSGPEGGDCLEVATCPRTVHVRDSKERETGPVLSFGSEQWRAFLEFASRSRPPASTMA